MDKSKKPLIRPGFIVAIVILGALYALGASIVASGPWGGFLLYLLIICLVIACVIIACFMGLFTLVMRWIFPKQTATAQHLVPKPENSASEFSLTPPKDDSSIFYNEVHEEPNLVAINTPTNRYLELGVAAVAIAPILFNIGVSIFIKKGLPDVSISDVMISLMFFGISAFAVKMTQNSEKVSLINLTAWISLLTNGIVAFQAAFSAIFDMNETISAIYLSTVPVTTVMAFIVFIFARGNTQRAVVSRVAEN